MGAGADRTGGRCAEGQGTVCPDANSSEALRELLYDSCYHRKVSDLSTVAVLGAGTMGVGIAAAIARSGHQVVLFDSVPDRAVAGRRSVAATLESGVRRGKLTVSERDETVGRVRPASSLSEIVDAAVVVEAIPEDLELKAEVLRRVEEVCSSELVLHTNTSTLSVTALAGRLHRPDRLIGTHYCNPADRMRLVEVAPARQTDPAVVSQTVQFMHHLGKDPVVLKDTPGLLTNYLLVPFENDCVRALEAGWATAEEIDLAVVMGAGFPMGVFRLLDLVGLDVHHAVSTSLYDQFHDPRFAAPPLVARMVAAGELGRKTGRGFYRYDDVRSR